MAMSPGSWSSLDSLKTSETRPTPVIVWRTLSLLTVTIPAPSWPRCWRAWRAR